MTRLLPFFMLFFAASFCAKAQDANYCGFDLVLQKMAQNNPDFQQKCTTHYHEALRDMRRRTDRASTVYEIPVVFHIVYNNEEQNLPDSVILNQMEILNQDYRRQNPDAENTREEFLDVAADTEIEFVLASVDPDGNPTDGINRVETDRESFEFDLFSADITVDEVKFSETGGADAWDPQNYLNIWVCNITLSGGLGQIFGFAYPPSPEVPNWEGTFEEIEDDVQGVVVQYTTVGSNNPAAGEDNFEGNEGGRTLTHEVGHYLGLRHTWGDGFFNGCNVDDGITDTPNISASNNFGCDFELNTCDEGDEDLPDQGENYMDYNQDACLNMFTQEQADMMRFVLEEFRPELIDFEGVNVNEAENIAFEVYPNPTADVLNIRCESSGWLTVTDLSGRRVLEQQVNAGAQNLNVQWLSSGSYILQFSTALGTTTEHILKR